MTQVYNYPKKPSGCLAFAGWSMLVIAFLLVAFGVFFWIDSDNKWNEGQQKEGVLMEKWEKEQKTRETAILRYDSISAEAFLQNDRSKVQAYEDSIVNLVLNDAVVGSEEDVELSRLDSLLGVCLKAGRGDEVTLYCDSIREYALSLVPPMPERKYLGFPLGGLLSVFVFIIAAFPFILGVILLVIYYSKRSNYRNSQRMNFPPQMPGNPIG